MRVLPGLDRDERGDVEMVRPAAHLGGALVRCCQRLQEACGAAEQRRENTKLIVATIAERRSVCDGMLGQFEVGATELGEAAHVVCEPSGEPFVALLHGHADQWERTERLIGLVDQLKDQIGRTHRDPKRISPGERLANERVAVGVPRHGPMAVVVLRIGEALPGHRDELRCPMKLEGRVVQVGGRDRSEARPSVCG